MSSGFLVMKAPLPDSFTVSTHKNTEESEESSPTQAIYVYNQESTQDSYIYIINTRLIYIYIYIYIPKRLLKYLAIALTIRKRSKSYETIDSDKEKYKFFRKKLITRQMATNRIITKKRRNGSKEGDKSKRTKKK